MKRRVPDERQHPVADLAVRVSPDTSGFRRKLKTEVGAASAGVNATVKAKLDTSDVVSGLSKLSQRDFGPKIFDFGARGIKPMNALYGVVLAMAPALTSVAATAVQAGTGVAALGSASLGAVTGVSALLGAFSNVTGALKEADSARKSSLRTSTHQAAKEITDARQIQSANERIRDAVLGVADARRGLAEANLQVAARQRDLGAANKQAIRDLEDLRRAVHDLRTEQSGASLDLRQAKEDQAAVNRNFFASDLERAQAAQKVKEAQDKLNNTTAERIRKTKDLALAERKGAGGSDLVRDARFALARSQREAADRQRDIAKAVRSVADARRDLADAMVTQRTAQDALAGADTVLADRLARMSKEGRELFHYLNGPGRDALHAFQLRMEAAVLPGFLRFLKDVGLTSRDNDSALGIMATSAERMGRIASRTAREAGKITKTAWFRSDLRKMNKENEKSFTLLGEAALTLVKPLTTIGRTAAPLFTRFSRWVSHLSDTFAAFIERQDRNGGLKKWFSDAGDAMGRWVDLGKAIIRTVMPIFTSSLPSGNNLLTRLTAFINTLGDWTNSPTGRREITSFFEKFRDLPYGDIGRFLGQLAVTVAAFKAVRMGINHPLIALWTVMAAQDPEKLARVMAVFSDFAINTLGAIDQHKTGVASLLALIVAAKGANKLIKMGISIPGVDNLKNTLTRKFSFLEKIFGGAQSTGTMTVRAGVVNVLGGGGVPGAVPGKVGPAGALAGLSPTAVGLIVASVAATVYAGVNQFEAGRNGKGPFAPVTDLIASVKNGDWAEASKAWLGVAAVLGPTGPIMTFVNATGGLLGKPKKPGKPAPKSIKDLAGGRGYFEPRFDQQGPPPAWMRDIRTEQSAFEGLKNWASTPGPTRTKALEEYIRARKRTVLDYVGAIRSQQGPIAAEKALQVENKKSEGTLRSVATQMGLSGTETNKYAEKIKAVPKVAETRVGAPGLTATKNNFIELKNRIDPVTGKKTITVTLNGHKTVFASLEEALTYQTALQRGLSLPAAKQRLALEREGDKKGQYVHNATGGLIPGHSPHPRADNIPAMLTANEYVHPVDAVKHYGVEFMEAVRTKRFPRYATGGRVAQSWPFKVDISKTMIPRSPLMDTAGGVASGSEEVAETAERVARAMGATTKQLVALMEAGLVESGMRNLNFGDRDSLGFLQQRASWGTAAQRRDVGYATRKFINKAKNVDKDRYSAGRLAQAVQVSAFPDRYDQRYADAVAVLNRNAPFVTAAGPAMPGGKLGGRGWRWQVDVLNKAGFGYHPSRNQTTGGGHAPTSWHYKGRAVDLSPPKASAFNWIEANYGATSKELFYTPMGYSVKNGKRVRPIDAASHYNHIHWAYRDGGLVARKYDNGGALPPGVTLAVNNTGKPENVQTAAQASAAQRLDRRDLTHLAGLIATAVSGQQIAMDGRAVAEVVRGYDYLPGGM